MTRDAVTSDQLPASGLPFSVAVRGGGLLFLSGQVAQDPATGELVDGDIAQQADQILHNIAATLAAIGKDLDDVIRVAAGTRSSGTVIFATRARHPARRPHRTGASACRTRAVTLVRQPDIVGRDMRAFGPSAHALFVTVGHSRPGRGGNGMAGGPAGADGSRSSGREQARVPV